MRKRLLWLLPLSLILLTVVSFSLVFTVPAQPQLFALGENNDNQPLVCYHDLQPTALDENGTLKLVVWNIYKQNREHWDSELSRFSRDAQLVLLQEASMTAALQRWIAEHNWAGTRVNAFQVLGESAGVLNLSRSMPQLACGYTEMEPWLRLPKSGIYALYALSNGQALAVVNLHAVNFAYGTEEYREQLSALIKELRQHKGPVIVAGDFNSWSEKRTQVLAEALSALGMKEAIFSPDNRARFINGLPLDHVFYKQLTLKKAKAPESDASDHNPLLLEFSLSGYRAPR
ncbi:endonuclease/exonuclease/phosphatase family protein [Vibrio fluvialis]|uniref:endonuclease/exonuclease/phosphatase family protein n=1 Tax=Vibrio fluvialis TaxID=676 RepID=UPI002B261DB3|nr:endonuclease/exonuclease/phosphatase family protein [Vibrio fluvialis]WPK53298.1 endonuclease/exonuclease/phosphatase family protein [Vibrio fluvialis]